VNAEAKYHLEIWNRDGTILFEDESPFTEVVAGDPYTFKNKSYHVLEVIDRSGEAPDGTIYFRRLLRIG
jgi:hypothetical protein